MTEREEPQPYCIGCHKVPEEIPEYTQEFTGEDIAPTEYVRREEGTYNPTNGHFLCTSCYVGEGMPTASGGWIAP